MWFQSANQVNTYEYFKLGISSTSGAVIKKPTEHTVSDDSVLVRIDFSQDFRLMGSVDMRGKWLFKLTTAWRAAGV